MTLITNSNILKTWLLLTCTLFFIGCDETLKNTVDDHLQNAANTTWQQGVFLDEMLFKDFCANPRTGADANGDTWNDMVGSAMHEKMFLRSWNNRTYLWYQEVTDRDPTDFTVADYFDQLKSNEKTNSGNNRDNFHFSVDTEEHNRQTQSGEVFGYGFEFAILEASPPTRETVVIDVEPNTQAAQAGVFRSMQIMQVDSALMADGDADVLNNALFPTQDGAEHYFVFRDPSNGNTLAMTLTATTVAIIPVKYNKVINIDVDGSTKKVGYVSYTTFGTHVAETHTFGIFSQFEQENIDELVVDLRYNGGGFVYLSSQLAYILAGSDKTAGKYYELNRFNDKYPTTNPITGESITPVPFYGNRVIDLNFTDIKLPELNLNRVYVLTTDNTCSASELLINGLRGVDVEIIQIGGTTCGKPYGFYAQENCSNTYFTIQFEGSNYKGFGEYSDGFVPSATDNGEDFIRGCTVEDDLTKNFGDVTENMLETALHHIKTDSCPTSLAKDFTSQTTTAVRNVKYYFNEMHDMPGKIMTTIK